MAKKTTHGGKRKNSGRKPTGIIRVNITIEAGDDAIAHRLGRGDRSKGIRLALRAAKAVTPRPQ